jgi:hypothetical protein
MRWSCEQSHKWITKGGQTRSFLVGTPVTFALTAQYREMHMWYGFLFASSQTLRSRRNAIVEAKTVLDLKNKTSTHGLCHWQSHLRGWLFRSNLKQWRIGDRATLKRICYDELDGLSSQYRQAVHKIHGRICVQPLLTCNSLSTLPFKSAGHVTLSHECQSEVDQRATIIGWG